MRYAPLSKHVPLSIKVCPKLKVFPTLRVGSFNFSRQLLFHSAFAAVFHSKSHFLSVTSITLHPCFITACCYSLIIHSPSETNVEFSRSIIPMASPPPSLAIALSGMANRKRLSYGDGIHTEN
jgi:hypothetical protein